jgi:hypothetical protein
MGYEVRRSDGTLYTREGRTLILPTETGEVSRIIGFPLQLAPPGDYELLMTVKDELSGKSARLREPFHVTAAPTRPAEAPSPPSDAPTGG